MPAGNTSFFTSQGRRFHELGFYYRVTLPDSPGGRVPARGQSSHRQDGPNLLTFRWFPLDDLGHGVRLLPPFLCEALAHPPVTTCHLVYRDEPAES